MKYLLSTIADVDFKPVNETEEICYVRNTFPVANKYGLGLELAEFCISDNMGATYNDVIDHFEYNRSNAAYVVLHAPYNELMPHAIDQMVVDVARKRYEWTLQLCKKYDIKKIVVHANYVHSLYYPQWFVARQIAFWKDFLYKHDDQVTICIENVMEPNADMLIDIIKAVDDPRLKMCLDVGHANLMQESPIEWLKKSYQYIDHYHIHNNKGPVEFDRPSLGDTHSALSDGIIDMKALLDLAEELTPNATASVESYAIEESAMWLKENGYI